MSIFKTLFSKSKEVEPDPVYRGATLQLMREFSTLEGADGEWKAHQVFARLIKMYPDVPKCDLRFEMEKLYQEHFK